MYRPEGLDNPYKKPIRDGVTWNKEVVDAFEAGADAECNGIIKKLESMPHGTTHCDILRVLRGEDES